MSENIQTSNLPIAHFCSRAISIFLLIFPLATALSMPALMQISDFLTSFYIAGRLFIEGKLNLLYPSPQAVSLLNSPFNEYTHLVLNKLPPNVLAVYMYPPTTLVLFGWLGSFSPAAALFIWQLFSIISLALCANLLASFTEKKWSNYFWFCPFFLPLIHLIWIGHLGIVLGLLPLALGLWLLVKDKPLLAGLVWSLLFLKPQFLPVVLLVMGALAFNGRFKSAAGFLLGALILMIFTLSYFGLDLTKSWLHTISLSDEIFSSGHYAYPKHLVASLPAAIVQALPSSITKVAKATLYLLAAILSLYTLIKCCRLIKIHRANVSPTILSTTFIVGILLLPLISPHLLLYDLSAYALAGMLICGLPLLRCDRRLFRALIFDWVFLNIYLLAVMFINTKLGQPILMVSFLAWLYWRGLQTLSNLSKNAN